MHAVSQDSIVIVAGPTASGKSALAASLAEALSGTVVNADSQQIYRDLPILTAQPSAATMARVPHLLFGAIDADESCSAGRWVKLALAAIAATREAGRLPILVGGTGLYLEALLKGLAEVPPIPASAREAAQALHARLGGPAFRAALATLDPAMAARLRASDTQRLVRAYEVATATGTPLSEWQSRQKPQLTLDATAVVLLPPRDELYAACDARCEAMVDRGAEAEVRALLARNLSPALPAMKAVGVREIGALLERTASSKEALSAMQQATRRYAKRQYTWFGKRLFGLPGVCTLALDAQFSESLLSEILSFIRQNLLTVPA